MMLERALNLNVFLLLTFNNNIKMVWHHPVIILWQTCFILEATKGVSIGNSFKVLGKCICESAHAECQSIWHPKQ